MHKIQGARLVVLGDMSEVGAGQDEVVWQMRQEYPVWGLSGLHGSSLKDEEAPMHFQTSQRKRVAILVIENKRNNEIEFQDV